MLYLQNTFCLRNMWPNNKLHYECYLILFRGKKMAREFDPLATSPFTTILLLSKTVKSEPLKRPKRIYTLGLIRMTCNYPSPSSECLDCYAGLEESSKATSQTIEVVLNFFYLQDSIKVYDKPIKCRK